MGRDGARLLPITPGVPRLPTKAPTTSTNRALHTTSSEAAAPSKVLRLRARPSNYPDEYLPTQTEASELGSRR